MATYVVPYVLINGTTAYSSSVNKYIDDFASTVNNLNSQNLVASSINGSLLDSAIIVADKLDASYLYFTEVLT